MLMIVKQILLVGTSGDEWRTVWRICILMLVGKVLSSQHLIKLFRFIFLHIMKFYGLWIRYLHSFLSVAERVHMRPVLFSWINFEHTASWLLRRLRIILDLRPYLTESITETLAIRNHHLWNGSTTTCVWPWKVTNILQTLLWVLPRPWPLCNAAYSAWKLWCLMYLMQRLSVRIEKFSSEQLSCRQELQGKNKMRAGNGSCVICLGLISIKQRRSDDCANWPNGD